MLYSSPIPPIDSWTASSLLQKAIRRNEVEYAEAAAIAFHRMRGNAIWRRLTLIAFEDVGPADPDLCVSVTQYATVPTARQKIGSDQEVVNLLVRQMCAASKNREADYMICAAKQAPFAERNRAALAAKTSAERIIAAGDPRLSLLDRSVAAWMASGINGGGPQVLSGGQLPDLMAHFSALGVCKNVTSAAISACHRTREPIVVMTPLLALSLRQNNEQPVVAEEALPPALLCNGIPSWVFDKHTRLGKSAIRQLLCENRNVRDCIAEFVPEYRALEVAAMGAFYADAISMTRRMVWTRSGELYQLGLRTDFTKIGTPEDGVMPIASVMRASLEHLNDIRRRLRTASYGQRLSWGAGDLEAAK
ncbi:MULTISPECIES: hypothetical protein [Rhizobium]|uniref:hypothetical protein n=1 Tax=Rhizobium TaxID=379 RepID=UPI0013EF18CD|nr:MULTISPECIES: hypothetical protein [Rhizobium]MBY5733424.1 hypothetical protein [Rhizobium leguminosarum]